MSRTRTHSRAVSARTDFGSTAAAVNIVVVVAAGAGGGSSYGWALPHSPTANWSSLHLGL